MINTSVSRYWNVEHLCHVPSRQITMRFRSFMGLAPTMAEPVESRKTRSTTTAAAAANANAAPRVAAKLTDTTPSADPNIAPAAMVSTEAGTERRIDDSVGSEGHESLMRSMIWSRFRFDRRPHSSTLLSANVFRLIDLSGSAF